MVPVRFWWTPEFTGEGKRPFDHLEIDTDYPIEPKVDAQLGIFDCDENGTLNDYFSFKITDIGATFWDGPHELIRMVVHIKLLLSSELAPKERREDEMKVADVLKKFYKWTEG